MTILALLIVNCTDNLVSVIIVGYPMGQAPPASVAAQLEQE
jgi:hypothetical protein